MALTDIKVRTAKPTDKQYKLTDGSGMHHLVHPNGSKCWRLQYRFDGKQKMLALGVYPEITLADARARRDEARKLLANGVDPGAGDYAVCLCEDKSGPYLEYMFSEGTTNQPAQLA